jgi:hypothetical protein
MICMAQQFQPKPVNFVSTSLRRKFIAPDNPREMGALVILIGLAVLIVSTWALMSDTLQTMGARSQNGELVATAPFRSSNAQRMVGVYIFNDEANVPVAVSSSRVYLRNASVPKSAKVIWPRGRPAQAKVVGEYYDYLLGAPIGLGIIGFGLWLRRKRPDPYEAALNPETTDENAGAS